MRNPEDRRPRSLRAPSRAAARRIARAAALLGLAAAVAACGGKQGLRGLIGVKLEQPNPFNVLPHAPLQLPSDLSALPAPQPGAASPLTPRPVEEARRIVGAAPAAAGAPSTSELALLDTAGAAEADPQIRETLAAEVPDAGEEFGLTEVLGYRIPDGRSEEVLVQRDESDRLREAGVLTPNPPPAAPKAESNEFRFGG